MKGRGLTGRLGLDRAVRKLPLLNPWPEIDLPGEAGTGLGVEVPVGFSDLKDIRVTKNIRHQPVPLTLQSPDGINILTATVEIFASGLPLPISHSFVLGISITPSTMT